MRFKAVNRLNFAIGGDHACDFLARHFFRAHRRYYAAAIDAGKQQHRRYHQDHHH